DLEPLFALRRDGVPLALLAFEPQDALLYGRVIRGADSHVIRIVEPKDATAEQLAVKTCYAGMLAADKAQLMGWLERLDNNNAKGEYYLTGVVEIAVHDETLVKAALAPETAVMGCDTPMQLSQAEAVFQRRRREHFLAEG